MHFLRCLGVLHVLEGIGSPKPPIRTPSPVHKVDIVVTHEAPFGHAAQYRRPSGCLVPKTPLLGGQILFERPQRIDSWLDPKAQSLNPDADKGIFDLTGHLDWNLCTAFAVLGFIPDSEEEPAGRTLLQKACSEPWR